MQKEHGTYKRDQKNYNFNFKKTNKNHVPVFSHNIINRAVIIMTYRSYPVPWDIRFRWAVDKYSKTRLRRDVIYSFEDLLG